MNQQEKSLILFYHEESQACQKLKQYIPSNIKIQILVCFTSIKFT